MEEVVPVVEGVEVFVGGRGGHAAADPVPRGEAEQQSAERQYGQPTDRPAQHVVEDSVDHEPIQCGNEQPCDGSHQGGDGNHPV